MSQAASVYEINLARKCKAMSPAAREVCAVRNYLGIQGERLTHGPSNREAFDPEESPVLYFTYGWTSFKDVAEFFELTLEQRHFVLFKAECVLGLRKQVARLGLTHQVCAERCEIPRSSFTAVFAGNVESVSLDKILAVCFRLGVSMRYEILPLLTFNPQP